MDKYERMDLIAFLTIEHDWSLEQAHFFLDHCDKFINEMNLQEGEVETILKLKDIR